MNNQEYYDTKQQLPDALAFVRPDRAETWIELSQMEQPLAVSDIIDHVDVSRATVYRMLDEFEDKGLISQEIEILDSGPKNRYQFAEGGVGNAV